MWFKEMLKYLRIGHRELDRMREREREREGELADRLRKIKETLRTTVEK